MRPGVSTNQRHVCRFDENAQRCRSQGFAGVGMIQIREITLLITPPKGGLLGVVEGLQTEEGGGGQMFPH